MENEENEPQSIGQLERKQITVTVPAYNALKKMQYNPKTGVKRKIIDIVSEMILRDSKS